MEELRGVAVERERMSRRCWDKFGSESLFALYSPFFVSLAIGNLGTQAFGECIFQDHQFLKVAIDAYIAAEECTKNDCKKMHIQNLKNSATQKIDTYEILVQEWGFEYPKEHSDFETIDKYRNLLSMTGDIENQKRDRKTIAAYPLGVIIPYMRLSFELFHQIKTILDPFDTTHMYRKWIDYYSSQDFEESVLQNENILDILSYCLTGDEVEGLEELYRQALNLQVKFLSKLVPMEEQTLVPLFQLQDPSKQLTIFCGYDMTCTIKKSDTILVDQTMAVREGRRISSVEWRKKWDDLSSQYSVEFEKCLDGIVSSVQECEKRANARVACARLSSGLCLEDIKSAGSNVTLHKGCKRFFQKIVEKGKPNINLHIISYCWCGDLIRSVLSPAISISDLHSNDLAYKSGFTTGDIIWMVQTAFDKLRSFYEVLSSRKKETEHMTVYIGGHVGDLLCLLEADIGIVVYPSSPDLMRLARHFGIKFLPLFPALVLKQKDVVQGGSRKWKSHGILYVSRWAEVEAFILGL